MTADGPPPSVAAQRRAWLTRRYREEVETLAESVRHEDGPFHADIQAAMARPEAEEIFAADGLSPALWPFVRDSLPTDPPSRRDLDALLVCDVPEDHINAMCGIYDDGSGLVVVSDALLSLITGLSQSASYCLHMTGSPLGWLRVGRTVLRNRRDRLTERQQVVVALTRYSLIQQRCFGGRGRISVRLDDRADSQAAVFAHHALWFVLAHEAGHFALGHPAAAMTSVDGADVPGPSDDPSIELAADAYGFAATAREAASVPGIDASGMAPVGVAIALLAIELTERALFVRLARTHPPAQERWAHLERSMDETAARTAQDMVALVRRPVLDAVGAPPLPAAAWAQVWRRSDVPVTSHNEEARAYTPGLDQALHGPVFGPQQLARLHPAMGPLAEQAIAIGDEDGLRGFLERAGVDEEAVTAAVDPTVGITFHTLLDWLETSVALQELPQREARLLVGSSLARILAPRVAAVGA